MASNNYTSANVVPSADTFREWVDLTNRITYDMEKYVVSTTLTDVGACTTGNSFVNGHFSASTLRVKDLILGAAADDPSTNQVGTNAAFANITFGTNTTFIANATHDSIVNAQSNVYIVNVGTTFVANTDGGFVTLNAIVNTFTSNAQNIDFNAESFDVQGGELTISSNVTVNSTANAVVIDTPNLVFSGNSTVGNVDVDAKLTHISSTNTTIDAGELNITSNVNIDAASVDIEDGELTISSNVTVNSTANAVVIDAPNFVFSGNSSVGNVDVDASLTHISSTNTTIDAGELNITSNVNIDAASVDIEDGELTISSNVTVNSTATAVAINANTDINANVDIDNDLTTITSTNTVIESGELNITSNVNFDAASFDILDGAFNVTQANSTTHSINIDPTTNTFTSNAGLNVLNTPLDMNANVDIDNDLVTITSSNTVVENGELNITSNVNFDAASFDILDGAFNVTQSNSTTHAINIDPTTNTFTSNAGLNVINTPLDVNANVDIDNDLTTITSTNTVIESGELNITSNVNFDAASFDILDGALSVTQSNSTTHTINIDPTTNTFVSNAGTNIFNTPLDINANIDVDNTTTDFDSTNFIVTGTTANITSTTLNIHGTSLDINSNTNIDGDVTLTANATVGDANTDLLTVNSNTVLTDKLNVQEAVDFDKSLNVDGSATFNGDVDLGDTATDTVTFNADVDSDILPNANGLNLGAATARWDLFGVTIDATSTLDVDGKATFNDTTTASYTNSTTFAASVDIDGGLLVHKNVSIVGNTKLGHTANDVVSFGADVDTNILPSANGKNLGSTTERWDLFGVTGDFSSNLNVTGNLTVDGNVDLGNAATDTVTFNADVDSNILPNANGLNLGATDARWDLLAVTIDATSTLDVDGKVTFNDTTAANSTVAAVHTDGGITVAKNAYIVGNTDIDGTITVDGLAKFNGNVDLGDAATDTVTFNADVDSDILPNANGLNLGAAAARWDLFGVTVNTTGDITAGQDVDVGNSTSGQTNTHTLRVRSTSDFEGDVTIGNSTVFVAVDESEGDLDVTGWSNSTFQSKSSFRRNLVVGNNVGGNTTLTLTVGPAGQNLVNAQSNTWQDWGTVVLSSETTGGKIAAANAQLATLVVTDSASLPSNTTLSIATANTNDLFVFNKAEFTGKANGDNYVKFGTTTQKINLNLANAQFTTSIFSANTDQDIGSTSAKWGNAFLNNSIQVGTFLAQNTTNAGTGSRANTIAFESDNVYARKDLVAKYRSDERLKDDLLVIDTAINKVEAISGYEFTWNDKIGDYRSGTKDYGVLAQEIEQILPHAVEETGDGIKSVNYNSLIPLLIEAVKELSGRLKKLEGDTD